MCHPLPLDHLLQVLEAAELLGIDIDIHVVDSHNANEVLDPRLDHHEEMPSIGSGLQSAPPNLPVKEEMLSEDLKPGVIEDYDRMIRIILLTTISCTHLDIVHSSQYV